MDGWYTYGIFYIPVNFVFNLPHYVTSYMHHTGKKERKKEILKKEKKNKVTKNLLLGNSNPDPQNQLEIKNQLNPLDHLCKRWQCEFKRGIYSFSMVIDSFQGSLSRFFF